MIGAFWRRIGIVLSFLLPPNQIRRYVQQMKTSGEFDRTFYFASNPRLRRLFRLAPERHYALFGEPAGLCPNPRFSPRAYLYNNPDIGEGQVRPLQHYIETGRAEQRTVLSDAAVPALPLPEVSAADHPTQPAPVAVVLHLYYHEMWPEFAAALAQQSFAFDLYVTLTGNPEDTVELQAQIRTAFPGARVWALPNHGRDIFPFLFLVNAGVLSSYRAVCKLHSKKSPHRADGDDWRQALTGDILGDPDRTGARLSQFLAQPEVGIWVADGQHYRGEDWWGMNRPRTAELLDRAGIGIAGRALSFPAGSIYWIKPPVMQQLAALSVTPEDFEPEQALVDGTTAHALERAMGYLTEAAGQQVVESSQLDT